MRMFTLKSLVLLSFLCLSLCPCSSGAEVSPEVYLVPYVGDIDGGISTAWYPFYETLLQWHNTNSIPSSFSFFPGTMDNPAFNQIIADMYTSENIELILKGENTYNGTNLYEMTYWQVREALEDWQDMFAAELTAMGFSDIKLPVSYNQSIMEFTENIRDAAHDIGFKIYLEHGRGIEYVDILPDFDITQYSVSLTISCHPGPDEVYKQAEELIQELIDFDHERLIYIDGIKVVPLLCHQQDFRMSEGSTELDTEKWEIYKSFLQMASSDPRILLLKSEEVYDLRHQLKQNYIIDDFETAQGWVTNGTGQGKFEIGIPVPFSPATGQCQGGAACIGTGPSKDHSDEGVNAVCTNLDGYMGPHEDETTNSLISPVYDFAGCKDVEFSFWKFMEIEGQNYDFCHYQYKDSPTGSWVDFEVYGTGDELVDDYSWAHYVKDFSNIADGKNYFQLRFYCQTDNYWEGSGVCMDDITFTWNTTSDFNADDIVNFRDFVKLFEVWLTNFGEPEYDSAYDLSGNDSIEIEDVLLFSEFWLWQGPNEYWNTASDFNGDNAINFLDFAKLFEVWLTSSGDPEFSISYDLSGNGSIEMEDIRIFSEFWLQD